MTAYDQHALPFWEIRNGGGPLSKHNKIRAAVQARNALVDHWYQLRVRVRHIQQNIHRPGQKQKLKILFKALSGLENQLGGPPKSGEPPPIGDWRGHANYAHDGNGNRWHRYLGRFF